MTRRYRLQQTQLVRRSLAEVFAFFSTPENLGELTPASMNFEIHSPEPIEMRQGAVFEHRIRLFGAPVRWLSRIEEFEPGRRFVDVQLMGPYRFWRHTHEFEETLEGTIVKDTIEYEMPLGPLGALAHRMFVRRTLNKIFDYRRRRIDELFGGQPGK